MSEKITQLPTAETAEPDNIQEAAQAIESGEYGICRFCGQLVHVGTLDRNFKGGPNEWASRHCECSESQQYKYEIRRKEDRKNDLERAQGRINDLYGEGAKAFGLEPLEDEIISLIYTAAMLVYDVKMKEATIAASSEIKAKICRTNKGKLQFSRSDATTTKQEV